jgi:AcrR family transcriptional regulator
MPVKRTKPVPRKPRVDAQRNRDRILEVAKKTFTRHGADVSLDDIAKAARVGPGTLYRNFPNRQALLEAVYATGAEELVEAERKFAKTLTPIEALRSWLHLFVDYIAAKQIIAPALKNLVGGPSKVYESSGAKITQTINALVERAIKSGDIRPDLDPIDLLRAIFGVSNVSPNSNWPQSARRLVDILILGSRPTQ